MTDSHKGNLYEKKVVLCIKKLFRGNMIMVISSQTSCKIYCSFLPVCKDSSKSAKWCLNDKMQNDATHFLCWAFSDLNYLPKWFFIISNLHITFCLISSNICKHFSSQGHIHNLANVSLLHVISAAGLIACYIPYSFSSKSFRCTQVWNRNSTFFTPSKHQKHRFEIAICL